MVSHDHSRRCAGDPLSYPAPGDAIVNPATTSPYFTKAADAIRAFANPLTNQAMAGTIPVSEVLEQINQFANQRLAEAQAQ